MEGEIKNSAPTNAGSLIGMTLRKNRKILETLNPTGKTKVTKAQLLDEGLKFSYFTNQYITQTGKVYNFCYEQGYIEIEKGLYALVYRHEYIE